MVLLPIIIFALYFVLLGFLIVGWNRLARMQLPNNRTDDLFVSVIIPARNEGSNIGKLLGDLETQDFVDFEVIVVDDHSEDNTKEVTQGFIERNSHVRMLANSGHGKKAALTLGIQLAKGSIIITTDADCRVPAEWISTLVGSFTSDNVKMVIACVKMEIDSVFTGLQALEFASLIGSGMAMASWRFPVMCNGANLAFRKSVFEELGGYSGNLHIPSGDDEFLMRKVLAVYRDGVEPVLHKHSVVTTLANRTLSELLQQRMRWAGKWSVDHSLINSVLALFIFGFQITVVSLPLFLGLGWIDIQTMLFLLFAKASFELVFLKNVAKILDLRWNWLTFAILQVVYPCYVVVIGLLSRFNSVEWKGRKLKSLTVSDKLNKEILG